MTEQNILNIQQSENGPDQLETEPLLGATKELKDAEGQEKAEPNIICCAVVKKRTTLFNVIGLILLTMVVVAVGAYVNVQMPFLL